MSAGKPPNQARRAAFAILAGMAKRQRADAPPEPEAPKAPFGQVRLPHRERQAKQNDRFEYPTASGGCIHIGDARGSGWQPVMMHERASLELQALGELVDRIVTYLAALDPEGFERAVGDVAELRAELAGITGGEASHGFKSRAALPGPSEG